MKDVFFVKICQPCCTFTRQLKLLGDRQLQFVVMQQMIQVVRVAQLKE